uniref:Uncharacterized protein n=1 Tax=Nelumbo nucifera TaxID=4432 RepID=A0A822XH65_NELNU|nr:TPA_asm: hypothetical protein HUJ06_019809 [Nelumbo nucifera]
MITSPPYQKFRTKLKLIMSTSSTLINTEVYNSSIYTSNYIDPQLTNLKRVVHAISSEKKKLKD